MANVGYVTLLLGLVLAGYAAIVAIIGARRKIPELVTSTRNAALGVVVFTTLSVIILEYLLITTDYQVKYVYNTTNNVAPLFFKITALWGSQAGSLLFWAWLMSIFAAMVIVRKWRVMTTSMPYVISITQVNLVFFLGLVVFVSNPFELQDVFPPPPLMDKE